MSGVARFYHGLRWTPLWPWLGALIPALASVGLVARYGVDVPYMDQWDIAPIFGRWDRGELTLGDLFAQHNESRKLFPRILFLTVGTLTGWNTRVEMGMTQVCVVGILVGLLLLARQSGARARAAAPFSIALASVLLFSPVQHHNFTFGIQIVAYLPALCLVLALVLARSRRPARQKALGTVALCTVATYSYANGMICWPLVACQLYATERDTLQSTRARVGALCWAGFALLAVAAYFWDYVPPAHHPGMREGLLHPGETLLSLLVLVGSPLGVGLSHTGLQAAAGAALLVFYAVFVATPSVAGIHARAQAPDDRAALLPWALLGAYALASAGAIALGRAGMSDGSVVHSRHVAFAVYLSISLAGALPISLRSGPALWVLGSVAGGLAVATFVVHVSRFPADERRRLQVKAIVSMGEHEVAQPHAPRAYPHAEILVSRSRELDRLGLLRPGLMDADLRRHVIEGEAAGELEEVNRDADGSLRVSGWAYLPRRQRPADAVLVTEVRGADGRLRPVALALPRAKRRDVAEQLGSRRAPRCGWSVELDPPEAGRVDEMLGGSGSLPALEAWALDAELGTLHALGRSP